MLININGLSTHSKLAIEQYVFENNIDILTICETTRLLSKNHFKNYSTFASKVGRGVSLSKHDNLSSAEITSLKNDKIDAVFVLASDKNTRLLVASIYIPPDNPEQLKMLDSILSKCREFVSSNSLDGVLILGDFNARHPAWSDHSTNKHGLMLFNLLQDRDLNISHPNGPTFVSVNGQSVIDLCICSTKILRSLSTVYVNSTAELFSGAPRRGHYPIIWSWRLFSKCQTVKQIKKDFDNADWTAWKTAQEDNLTAELDGILESDDPETIWDITKSTLIRTVDTTIPVKLLSNHSKPFWNSKLSELSLTLRRNRIAYRKRNNKENLEELLKSKDAFKEEINSGHNSWLQRNLDHLNKADTTNFWKRYKTTLLDRDKSKMGPLKNDQNEILFNPQEKSDLLRKSFFTGEHLASENFSTQSNIENYLSASRALKENSHAMGACLISHSDVEEALRCNRTIRFRKQH